MPELNEKPACALCLIVPGRLCHSCARGDRSILPQLAVNVGWLRMMGEVLTEQKKRQTQRAEKLRVRPPISKARQRKAKKNAVRNRFARALRGEHTRVTKAVA